jgi:putative oxidoreductase
LISLPFYIGFGVVSIQNKHCQNKEARMPSLRIRFDSIHWRVFKLNSDYKTIRLPNKKMFFLYEHVYFLEYLNKGKMEPFESVDQWVEKHTFSFIDLLRVLLGACLIWKGVVFGRNQYDIPVIVDNGPFDFLSLSVAQYIVMAHLAGGFLIFIGLITRIAILFQIPILVGAVIYTPMVGSHSFYSNEFLAVSVLVLLIVFLFYGSGKFSADQYLKRHPNA